MKSKELAEELLKYPNLDVVVRVSISASTYDYPYGEYDMRYIDSISCIGTKDGNAVIALEQMGLIMPIYIVHYSDYDSEFDVGYFTSKRMAKLCKEYYEKNEPCSYSECGYEILEFSPNDVDYEALNKNFDDAMRMKKLAEEEEFRNKELAELARLKAKYEGQQDDLQ